MTIGNKVSFGDPEDITLPSEDGQSMRVRFEVVLSEVVGTSLEPKSTTRHELIVRLSGSRARSWGLDAEHGRAVMVHMAIEHVFEVARHREFAPSEELLINTGTFPGSLPERFDRPITVAGSTIEVERDKNPIGFK